jgi:hypothetical protein
LPFTLAVLIATVLALLKMVASQRKTCGTIRRRKRFGLSVINSAVGERFGVMELSEVKLPVHLWIVASLSVLWTGFAVYDWVMSVTQGEPYYRSTGMTEGLIAYYKARPGWVFVPWTLGVLGAIGGSVLLLVQSRHAVPLFTVSLLGALLSNLATLIYAREAFLAKGMYIMPLIILAVCLFQLGYSALMRQWGFLT